MNDTRVSRPLSTRAPSGWADENVLYWESQVRKIDTSPRYAPARFPQSRSDESRQPGTQVDASPRYIAVGYE